MTITSKQRLKRIPLQVKEWADDVVRRGRVLGFRGTWELVKMSYIQGSQILFSFHKGNINHNIQVSLSRFRRSKEDAGIYVLRNLTLINEN